MLKRSEELVIRKVNPRLLLEPPTIPASGKSVAIEFYSEVINLCGKEHPVFFPTIRA
jgi:hypothetical protein